MNKTLLAMLILAVFLSTGCHHWGDKGHPGELDITSIPCEKALAGKKWQYQVDAITTLETTLKYTLLDCSSGMSLSSTGILSWTPSEDQVGWNFAAVEVSDGQNEKVQYMEIKVEYPDGSNHAPVITSRPLKEAEIWKQYVYDVNVTDIDGDGFSFALAYKGDDSIQINQATGVITWIPEDSQAGETVRMVVVVSDDADPGQEFTEQDFTVKVVHAEAVPRIVSPAQVSAHAGYQYQYRAVAVDDAGGSIIYYLPIAPDGMTVNSVSGIISWLPGSSDIGNHAVILRASNGENTATQNFMLQVFTDDEPRFTTSPVLNVLENESWSYSPVVEYSGNGSMTFSLEQAPVDMTINSLSGEVEWTPAAESDEFNAIIIAVSDGVVIIRQSFTLQVTRQD